MTEQINTLICSTHNLPPSRFLLCSCNETEVSVCVCVGLCVSMDVCVLACEMLSVL